MAEPLFSAQGRVGEGVSPQETSLPAACVDPPNPQEARATSVGASSAQAQTRRPQQPSAPTPTRRNHRGTCTEVSTLEEAFPEVPRERIQELHRACQGDIERLTDALIAQQANIENRESADKADRAFAREGPSTILVQDDSPANQGHGIQSEMAHGIDAAPISTSLPMDAQAGADTSSPITWGSHKIFTFQAERNHTAAERQRAAGFPRNQQIICLSDDSSEDCMEIDSSEPEPCRASFREATDMEATSAEEREQAPVLASSEPHESGADVAAPGGASCGAVPMDANVQLLRELFPSADESVLQEALLCCQGSVELAFEMLEDYVEDSDPEGVASYASLDQGHSESTSRQGHRRQHPGSKKRARHEAPSWRHDGFKGKVPRDGGPARLGREEWRAERNRVYDEARAQQFHHAMQRKQYREQAVQASRRGDHVAAARFSNLADEAHDKFVAAQKEAKERIMRFNHEAKGANLDVDLHALHVDEALEEVDKHLGIMRMSPAIGSLTFITGKGNHSAGGVPRIKTAVIEHLQRLRVAFHEPTSNTGQVVVNRGV